MKKKIVEPGFITPVFVVREALVFGPHFHKHFSKIPWPSISFVINIESQESRRDF